MNRSSVIHVVLASAIVGGSLSACGGSGPSEAEFVQACLKTQATKAVCECGAKTAKDSLPADHYRMMVLDMQGKRQELEAMSEKMNFEQRATFAQEQFQVLGKCAEAK